LWLFNTYLKGDQNQKLVVKLDLLGFNTEEEFGTIFDQLWLLSKPSLASPSAINSWMEQRRLDQGLRAVLLNQHSASVKAIVADLAMTVGVSSSPEDVVQWMRGQLMPSITVLPTKAAAPPIYEPKAPTPSTGPTYWMMPCGKAPDGEKPVETLRRWLDKRMWGFNKSTAGRKHLQAGDYVCFYAAKVGVVATARIAGPADTILTQAEWPEPTPMDHEVYKVPLKDILWLPQPRPLTKAVRAKLDVFKEHGLDVNPGFLVQTTRKLTPHDFEVLAKSDVA
jgi:hypothetical protein